MNFMCMTAKLDVMPKTTEQNRIVRTGKFEVEVTNSKKTVLNLLYYWSNEANYLQHGAASLRQQSYLFYFSDGCNGNKNMKQFYYH